MQDDVITPTCILRGPEKFSSTNGGDLYKHWWKSYSFLIPILLYDLLCATVAWYDHRHSNRFETGWYLDDADASGSSDNVSSQFCLGCVCHVFPNKAEPWLITYFTS